VVVEEGHLARLRELLVELALHAGAADRHEVARVVAEERQPLVVAMRIEERGFVVVEALDLVLAHRRRDALRARLRTVHRSVLRACRRAWWPCAAHPSWFPSSTAPTRGTSTAGRARWSAPRCARGRAPSRSGRGRRPCSPDASRAGWRDHGSARWPG